jgi:DNA-binding MurR/RpiR family transcriptional regulator
MEHIIKDKIQQHYSNLTGSQRALSHFIMDHTDEVPFLSSSLLARKVGISDASVTRFCTVLGYSGYADFQRDMQRCLQKRLAPFERMEKSARGEKENIYRGVYELV